jgi:hypothetical protein
LKELGPKFPASPMGLISITIQPLTPSTTSRAASQGGNSLGLDDSKTALVLCLFGATWDDPADDETVNSVAKQVNDRIMAESKRRGLWNCWVYLNYASQWQDLIQGYEITNKVELQSVS